VDVGSRVAVAQKGLGDDVEIADAGAAAGCLIDRPAISRHDGAQGRDRGRIGSQLIPGRLAAGHRAPNCLETVDESVQDARAALVGLELTTEFNAGKRSDLEAAPVAKSDATPGPADIRQFGLRRNHQRRG
jgi:hypothetical protein